MTYKEEEEEEDMTYILMGTTAPIHIKQKRLT